MQAMLRRRLLTGKGMRAKTAQQRQADRAVRKHAAPCQHSTHTFPPQYLLSYGIHVRGQLPQRDAAVLRHHARTVQLAQPFVWVGLQSGGGGSWTTKAPGTL